jgi:hypothetical protein
MSCRPYVRASFRSCTRYTCPAVEALEARELLSGAFPNNVNPPPLPAPTGPVVHVSNVTALAAAVSNLQSGQTILIDPGTYTVTDTLYLPQGISNVAVRGTSGKASDVVIQGPGMSGSILFGFWTGNVSGVTFGDFTIRGFADHAFILNAGTQSPLIHDVTMIDMGEQFVKSNPDGTGGGVNNGIVEYCNIGYSTTAPSYYTNGVDVHTGANWIVRDNVFTNIRAVGVLAGPTILFWNGSSGALTDSNTFINCQRAIAYGLDSTKSNDNTGGIIRNNFITETMSIGGDTAIGVNNSAGTQVLNNSIWMNNDYPNAIEYRFSATTGVKIQDNLTNMAIVSRDGATGTVSGNLTNAQSSWFVNAGTGDLHLTAAATAAIGQGAPLANVPNDYNGEQRPTTGKVDIGADEMNAGPAVSVTAPAAGATVSGTATMTASASALGSLTIAAVQFYVDGTAVGSPATAAPYTGSWDTTHWANGTPALTAKATDSAGVSTTSAVVYVTVSNAPPGFAYDSASKTLTITGTASPTSFTFSQSSWMDGSGTLHTTYTFTLNGATASYADTALSHVSVTGAPGSANSALLLTNDSYTGADGLAHETAEAVILGSGGAGELNKVDAQGNSVPLLTLSGFTNDSASMGPADTALIVATTAVQNFFVSAGSYAYMNAGTAFYGITGAKYVYALAVNTSDVAYHYDGSGPSALVVSGTAYSFMQGTDKGASFFNEAVAFKTNYGIAQHAGQDTAIFYDSPLNDVFVGNHATSYLYSDDAQNHYVEFDYAQGFALVEAFSFVGGTDYAYVYDPAVNAVVMGFHRLV